MNNPPRLENGYFDLGAYQLKVTTKSPEAQVWFDQGLLWAYSFNHDEAVRCFTKATEKDPSCAMAYWGIAYASGPNYNKAWARFDVVDFAQSISRIQKALENALNLSPKAQPIERSLIEGLATRFPIQGPPPSDFTPFDEEYATAMRRVAAIYEDHLDVSALFAESLMCKRPRRLWSLEDGEPTTPETLEAQRVLEAGMAQPGGMDHPALTHMYIHLMEGSFYPEKAIHAADQLRRLVPYGSHMQHMATHVDVACGDYRRAIDSNKDAMVVDDLYFRVRAGTPMYSVYRAHNVHVLAYAAMMAGRSEDAIMAGNRLMTIITPELLRVRSPPMDDWAEYLHGTLVHVLVRFGLWHRIIEAPLPAHQDLMPITTATYFYGRGLAYAALGRVSEGRQEKEKLQALMKIIPPTRQYGLNCLASQVLGVALLMLEGELLYREKNIEEAFSSLRAAVAAEDGLSYADPPFRMQPSRHALGALLLEQGRVEEAEKIYRQDLGLSSSLSRRKARLNNVWAWHGLLECLDRSGKHEEVAKFRLQRDIAVAGADVNVTASCCCRLDIDRGNGAAQCC